MAVEKIYTTEETLQEIRKAAEQRGDSFRVRIHRKRAPHILSLDLFASFDEVEVKYLECLEAWLPALSNGGGQFEVTAYHASDIGKPVGGVIRVNYPGDAQPVDAKIVYTTEWVGPKKLLYPKIPGFNSPAYGQANQGALGSTPAQTLNQLPTNTVGSVTAREAATVSQNSSNPYERAEASRLISISAELERKEREVAERERRLELEALKKEVTSNQAAEPRESWVEKALPVFMTWMQAQDKKAEAAAAIAAEERRFQQQQTIALFERLAAKPAVDPHIERLERLIEKVAEKKEENNGTMMQQMATAMGSMTTTTLQLLHGQAELIKSMQPEEEAPMLKLANRFMDVMKGAGGQYQAQLAEMGTQGNEGQMNGYTEGAPPPPQKRKLTPLQALERSILRMETWEQVSKRFNRALRNAEFRALVQKHNGDFTKVIEERLGAWAVGAPDRIPYLQRILPLVYQAAVEAGLLLKPEPVTAATATEGVKAAPAPRKVRNGAAKNAVVEVKPEAVEVTEAPASEKAEA